MARRALGSALMGWLARGRAPPPPAAAAACCRRNAASMARPDSPPSGDRGPGRSSAYERTSGAWSKWGGGAAPPPQTELAPAPPPPRALDAQRETRGAQAHALLTSLQVDPARVSSAVTQAVHTPGALAALSGAGLAALLATAALVRDFNAALFDAALGDCVLRAKHFTAADRALLAHVHVATRLHAAAQPQQPPLRGLPPDVALTCLAEHNAAVTDLQGVYDPLALALRRMGVPLVYRQLHDATGYLVWLTLPPTAAVGALAAPADQARASAAGKHRSYLRGVPATSIPGSLPGRAALAGGGLGRASWVLEVDGDFNCIPGTASPSLGSRLQQANMEAAGLRVARVTCGERARLLGPGAASAIDARRVGDDDAARAPRARARRGDAESLPELLAHIVSSMRRDA